MTRTNEPEAAWRRSRAPEPLDFEIEKRLKAGTSPAAILEEFKLSIGSFQYRLWKVQIYREAEEILAKVPLAIHGLSLAGAIPSNVANKLQERGAERLSDLCDWSEAELLRCPGIGRKGAALVRSLMAQHGLKLHPERSQPVERMPKNLWGLSVLAEPAPARQVGNVVYVDFRA